jgi:hypothetical protein
VRHRSRVGVSTPQFKGSQLPLNPVNLVDELKLYGLLPDHQDHYWLCAVYDCAPRKPR